MAEQTAIEWADSTFNPWIGCTRVGPGCDHCYAAISTPARTQKILWGAGESRKRTSLDYWKQPVAWNRHALEFHANYGRRRRVFTSSLADVFDNEVPREWRLDLLRLVLETPNLDWLVLTKRIGNAARMLQDVSEFDGRLMNANDQYQPLSNLWLGATVVNQEEADRDIPKLVEVPAAMRFLSIEPQLGLIDMTRHLFKCCGNKVVGGEYMGQQEMTCCGNPEIRDCIDWVIAGGESGPNARPSNTHWFTSLRDQCKAAGVPFLFKQWGEWAPSNRSMAEVRESGLKYTPVRYSDDWPYPATVMDRVGKKAAGRLLEGVEHNEFPRSTPLLNQE